MDKIELSKILLRIFASASVGSVVGTVIKMNLPLGLGFREKLMMKLGSFIISGVAEDHTDKYVEEFLDKVFILFKPKEEEKTESETI